jgi:hypothetical protein
MRIDFAGIVRRHADARITPSIDQTAGQAIVKANALNGLANWQIHHDWSRRSFRHLAAFDTWQEQMLDCVVWISVTLRPSSVLAG